MQYEEGLTLFLAANGVELCSLPFWAGFHSWASCR